MGQRIHFSDYYAAIGAQVIAGRAFNPSRRDLEKIESVPKGKKYVLIIPNANPRYLLYLENAIAVISEQGGMLCHMAIVCRELGIPYIRLEKATEVVQNGEWVELVPKPETLRPEPSMEWVKLLSFLPELPPENIQQEHLDSAKHLPAFINKEYELTAMFRGNGLYVSKASLDKFLADLRRNVDILAANLKNYHQMSNQRRQSVMMLSTVAIDQVLFPLLVELTSDRDLALSLIRSGYAHYLEVGPSLRWGDWVSEFPIPRALKERLETAKRDTREELKVALQRVKEPYKVKQIAEVIRLLVRAYERKG